MDEAAAEFEELFSLNWNYFLFSTRLFLASSQPQRPVVGNDFDVDFFFSFLFSSDKLCSS
jgi:hypothetical protein